VATETEIKLSLSPRAASKLVGLPLLAGLTPLRQKLLNTYYDTPDLRLQRERVAVRYRKKGRQWLFTVKCAAPSVGGLARRNEWEVAGRPGDFDFSHVDDRKLRHRLESLRDQLSAVFTTNFTRTAWIIEPQAGVRIELALDRGWIEAPSVAESESESESVCASPRTPLRLSICEVELELLAGEADALFTLASQLQKALEDTLGGTQRDAFALHPEAASKAERGYRLFTATPLQAQRASPVTLGAENSSLVAFRAIALACVTHLQDNEQGVRESDDPEFVHQARVAIRRLRSAIRLWKPQLPEAFVATYDAQWRALALILGDARNWDVFLSEMLPELARSFPEHGEIRALSRYASQHGASRRKRVRAALKSVAYSRLLLEFTAVVLKLAESTAPAPLNVFAVHCLKKRAKKVIRQASAPSKDAASRHRCRVALKRLRYALEFFDSLLPQKHLESYHQAVTQLQDLLGQMNDLDVAVQLIEEALPTPPADEIHAWISQRNDLLLHKLDKSINAFLRQKPPWKDR
jgi:inorganic triphosphatase YgiF